MKCKQNVHFNGFQQGKTTELEDPPRSDAFKMARKVHFLTQQKLDNFWTRTRERYWRLVTFSPRCPKST